MTKVLGKKQNPNKSGKSLLDPIQRNKDPIKHGIDIWNVYDFMYLDRSKMPKLRILEIIIPSSSLFTIESKSMKLYLNEFYKKSFKKDADVIKKIQKDIESISRSTIKIKFLNKFFSEPKNIELNKLNIKNSKPNTVLKFNGFRSICPVTSQPDLANIYIYSNEGLSINWLKKYLLSYQEQGDFHELK